MWYGTMLREICEYRERIGPTERRALKRAIVDLQEIRNRGTPETRAGAAEALFGISGYFPDLFKEAVGTSADRGRR